MKYTDPALESFQKSLELREKLGHQLEISNALTLISEIRCNKGDFWGALDAAKRAIAMAKNIGALETLSEAQLNFGRALLMLKEPKGGRGVQRVLIRLNRKLSSMLRFPVTKRASVRSSRRC